MGWSQGTPEQAEYQLQQEVDRMNRKVERRKLRDAVVEAARRAIRTSPHTALSDLRTALAALDAE